MRTAAGGAAAAISSGAPSTQATGPPWLAVCVVKMSVSCFNQARRAPASATTLSASARSPGPHITVTGTPESVSFRANAV